MLTYKIGQNLYNGSDKNCGMYEYELIKKELYDFDDKKLFIVNGLLSENDKTVLKILMDKLERKDIVFILTDLSLMQNNIEIIKQCGILLHSSKNPEFGKNICERRYYSFIPDLYYDDDRQKCRFKSDIIVFGGSFGNTIINDENVSKYVMKDGKVNDKILFMYKNGNVDYRIPYEEYKKVLDLSKYILCIKRKNFIQDDWITPRLLDGISSYCFPLVDYLYDYEYDYPLEYQCRNYDDVVRIVDYMNKHELEKEEVINTLRRKAKERKVNFTKLVNSL